MTSLLPSIKFEQAHGYYKGRLKPVRLIVFHTMEYPERSNGAEWCIDYFAGAGAPQASTHYAVDSDSICQGVRETDTAWAAPMMNADGLQVEHAGFAAQTRNEWQDVFSRNELDLSAKLFATLCVRWNIPPVHLSNSQLAAGQRGIVGHVQGTQVYGGTHTDPGASFVWDLFIPKVAHYVSVIKGGPTPGPTPTPVSPVLAVDGYVGRATILRAQQVMGTPADGTINQNSYSPLVAAIQSFLNSKGASDWNGKRLIVDGIGLGVNTSKATAKSRTQWALQDYLGTTKDGVFNCPSGGVQEWQRHLNKASVGSKKF